MFVFIPNLISNKVSLISQPHILSKHFYLPALLSLDFQKND
jgi:hypothetical protein